MNKKLLLVFSILITISVCAQEYTTNDIESSYKFQKLVHLDASPVQSQGYTGTCWSFSALSFFESEMMRKGNKNAPLLSEMYVVRKAYEGKSEKYIRMDGKTNFEQGGAFHDIPWVFKNYGIVPAEVYGGKNYGLSEHNHRELFAGLHGYVEGVLDYVNNKGRGTLSPVWKQGVNGILDAYLGPDPTEFKFNGKKYTPKSYANETGLNMDDYVSITSFTHFGDYEECMLAIQDNWAWGKSYNVPLNELLEITETALRNGYTVAWGADVSERGFNFRNGLAIIPEDESTIMVSGNDNRNISDAGAEKLSNAFLTPVKELTITSQLRQEAYDNKTTTDDHGMHITGLYKEANGTTYFLVKNSWGTNNHPQGYLYVSENYFKYKTINVYLHKEALNSTLRKKLGI